MQVPFYLRQLEVGPMENFTYLIGDPVTRQALIVDPAWQVDTILRQAEADEMKVVGALVSHHHRDHTNGIEDLLEVHQVPIFVNKHDAPHVPEASEHLVKTDHGHEVSLGGLSVKCLHTPGHTPGSQCFEVRRHLVTGDTLFVHGCGRCDLPGGDPEQMYYTLTQKLMQMPDDTVVLPGHNYAPNPQSTLGEEKKTNPFLKTAGSSLKDFLTLRMGKRK
ncbi:MAG: MBL fold metallo-hydrolase [Deltaproteobacteria bacterium]|nr:MBL fold metallo-hydrolase [Deltaproteobacteria bacterium]